MDKAAEAARIDVWKYALGFAEMSVVKCAIELGLPDILESHGSPMTLSELSSTVGCPETSLQRILRFLTHKGIFTKETNSPIQYAQSPLSRLLSRDNMGACMIFQAGTEQFGLLPAKDVKAGKGSGVGPASTEDQMWDVYHVDEKWWTMFKQFLYSHAKAATGAVIDTWPGSFQGVSSLVDVGGHHGTAVEMLVKAFPGIRGINFDLPVVVAGAPVVDGVDHVAGNMFEKIPQADAVMLMWILHDWSDELCIEILKKCKEAVPKDGGKVMIVEAVIDEEEKPRDGYSGARLALDMTMMCATPNGKERTAGEWAELIEAAGFSKHTFKHMEAIDSLIEAYP